MVARHVAVVAPPDVDAGPRDGVDQGRGREPPVDPDRGRATGRRPVRPAARADRVRQRRCDQVRGGDRTGLRIGDDDDLRVRHVATPSGAIERGSRAQRTDRDRIAPARLDRLGQQVGVRPPRGPEMAVERLDAVLPDADVDGLGLGGHVGPQLRPATLGQQFDPERRARAASPT